MTKKFKFKVPESSLLIGPTGPPGEPGPTGPTGATGNNTFIITRSTGPVVNTAHMSENAFMLIDQLTLRQNNASIIFPFTALMNNLLVLAFDPVGKNNYTVSVLINNGGTNLFVTISNGAPSARINVPGGVFVRAGDLVSLEFSSNVVEGSQAISSFTASFEVTPT